MPTRSAATLFVWLAAGYCLLLTYLLLTPAPLWWMGETGQEVEATVDVTVSGFVQHVIAYAILTGLLVLALRRRSRRGVAVCVALACVHGLIAEGLQSFVPLRCCDWPDALADCLGASAIWLVVGVIAVCGNRAVPDQSSV